MADASPLIPRAKPPESSLAPTLTLGHAAETQFAGPPNLAGARNGAAVVVLGAGLAGLPAAHELTKAGYKVQILEYQHRAGGRTCSLRGGDTYTERGGATQKVSYAPGNYFNPGPWRIPHHHKTLLHYRKQFGVALEPVIQFNHNTWIHASQSFGGKPVRFKAAAADVEGYERPPGGGINGAPIPSALYDFHDVLDPQVWSSMAFFMGHEMQTTMFQPVGGMNMIG